MKSIQPQQVFKNAFLVTVSSLQHSTAPFSSYAEGLTNPDLVQTSVNLTYFLRVLLHTIHRDQRETIHRDPTESVHRDQSENIHSVESENILRDYNVNKTKNCSSYSTAAFYCRVSRIIRPIVVGCYPTHPRIENLQFLSHQLEDTEIAINTVRNAVVFCRYYLSKGGVPGCNLELSNCLFLFRPRAGQSIACFGFCQEFHLRNLLFWFIRH